VRSAGADAPNKAVSTCQYGNGRFFGSGRFRIETNMLQERDSVASESFFSD
jgi:hypothetical protein